MFLHSSWAWCARSSKLYLFASVIVNEPELTLCKSAQAFWDTLAWWTSPSSEWKVAAELPAGVILRFTVSSSTLYARVIPLWQCWLQRRICIQFTYSRKTLDCLSCIYSSCTKLWFKWRMYSAEKRCWAWPACRRQPTWRLTHSMLSHTEAEHGCSTIALIIASFPWTQATMCWTLLLLQLLQQLGMQYLLKG